MNDQTFWLIVLLIVGAYASGKVTAKVARNLGVSQWAVTGGVALASHVIA